MSTEAEGDVTVVSLRNTTGKVDPFRYPADVGALADALLLSERIVVLVEILPEVLGIAAWLGDAFAPLLREGTLRFFFPQGNLEPTIVDGELHVVAHSHSGPVFQIAAPERASVASRNIEAEIQKLLATYPYIPDGFAPPESFGKSVAEATVLTTSRYPELVRLATARLLSDAAEVSDICNTFFAARGLENPFPNGFAVDTHGRLISDRGDDLDRKALHLLLQQLQRFFVSALLGAEVQLVETGGPNLLAAAARAAGEPRATSAFSEILDLERIPSVRASVLMDEIPGQEIIRLRNSTAGRRFRTWLRQRPSEETPKDVLRAYHQTVGSVVHADSLGFSGLRVLASLAAGILNPLAGIIASVADFGFTKGYYRERWHPRLFVRNLPTRGDPTLDPDVPFDPATVIRIGARVEKAAIGPSGAFLRLAKRVPDQMDPANQLVERWNVDYGPPSVHVYRLLNARMALLLDAADASIIIECQVCRSETPVPPDFAGRQIACRACKNFVFPFRLP